MDITITKVIDESKGEHTWKTIYYNDAGKEHKKAIFLKDKYDLLYPGAYVDLVLTQNGFRTYEGRQVKNWEITDIKPLAAAPPVAEPRHTEPAVTVTSRPDDPRQRSIERQNALTNAVDFCARLKYNPLTPTIESVRDVLTVADMLVNWTSQGIIPIPQTEAVSEPLHEEKPSDVINLKGAGYEDTVKNMGKSLGFTTIKHLADFMKANAKVLQNRTDWKSFDADLQYALVTLLQAEIEKMKI